MTKLDWNRSRDGRDGYDANLAREWSTGPRSPDFDRPDGSDVISFYSAPTIFWAKDMARSFPADDAATHLEMFSMARRVAAHIYYEQGWPALRSRVLAVHAKASLRNIFPSAFYAIYFDHWAMVFARGHSLNTKGSISKSLDAFSSRLMRWERSLPFLRVYDKKYGPSTRKTPAGFNDWMSDLTDAMESGSLSPFEFFRGTS